MVKFTCTNCGTALEIHHPMDGNENMVPDVGDALVCFSCGTPHEILEDWTLAPIALSDLDEDLHEQIQEAQRISEALKPIIH